MVKSGESTEAGKPEAFPGLTGIVEARLGNNAYAQLAHAELGANIRLFRRSKEAAQLRFEARIDGRAHGKPEDIFLTGDYMDKDWSVMYGVRPVHAALPWRKLQDRHRSAVEGLFAGLIYGPQAMLPAQNVDKTWTGLVGDLPISERIPDMITGADITGHEPIAPTYLSEFVSDVQSAW